MSTASSRIALDDLLRHESFVRATLRGLLRDEGRVDDAVQETWLRAAKRPPSQQTDPRAWLAKVARNIAISSWRSERRRARREAAIEQDTATAETAERSRERVEMRQRVVAAVLALEEPYRAVVLLRYEEGLSNGEVARRLGRSAATVRSQLSRAHEILRRRLDGEFGGRERWAVLAVPLVRSAKRALLLPAVGAVLLVTASTPFWPRGASAPPPAVAHGAAIMASDPVAEDESTSDSSDAVVRESVAPTEWAEVDSQDPRRNERLLAAATLCDRGYYLDYERATFSFLHGTRDDPAPQIVRNDWDIYFTSGRFRVDIVTDDQSVIADLGELSPRDFGRLSQFPTEFAGDCAIAEGHAYYIGTRDTDSDLATVIFVRSHEPGRTCEFDWYTTDGTGRAQGSLRDPRVGKCWIEVLTKLRASTRRGSMLTEPRVVLQVRAGSGGGNPNRVNMAGETSAYVDRVSQQELDITPPIESKEESVAYSRGGWIPEDYAFVVTRIRYEGSAAGDSNGQGEFRLMVGGKRIASYRNHKEPIVGEWTEPIELTSGQEAETYLTVANSSAGCVVLDGTLVPRPTRVGFNAPNRGFFAERQGVAAKPERVLTVPEVVLQLRTGHNGGNGARLDLRCRKDMRLDELRDQPLDFSERGPRIDRRTIGYGNGGLVGDGRVFVITKAVYHGDGVCDQSYRKFRLVIGGEKIVDVEDPKEPIEGVWTGRIEVVPGEESRTYLELANATSVLLTGEVRLSGHFEKR